MATDLSEELRAAIIAASSVTDELPAWFDGFPVHTRRPVPADTPTPFIAISPDVSNVDTLEQLSSQAPEIIRDIGVYAEQATAADYRKVERIAYAIRDLFHRTRRAITVSGYTVKQILATGPIPAPVDDDADVGRIVTLTIQLVKA